MKKALLAICVGLCAQAFVPGTASAAGKKPAKAGPVDITFQNTCTNDLALKLGTTDVKVAAGQTALVTIAPEKPGEALPLATLDATPVEWARFSFVGGGKWEVKIAACAEGKGDAFARQTLDPAAAGSPLATAQVRYRARVRGFIEYQGGDTGSFKPLSVAMTSYVDAAAGDLTVQLRKKGGAAGPVLGLVKKVVPILPGRKQVVEVDYGSATPFVLVEDEGPVGAK